MMKFVVLLVVAILVGAVVGFLLGGLAATAVIGPDTGEYQAGLFQTAGTAVGVMAAAAVVAVLRKHKK